MVDGSCSGIVQVGSFYLVYAVFAFSTFYAIPSIVLILLYGFVIVALRRRMLDSSLGRSVAIEKASFKVRSLRLKSAWS